MEIFQRPMCLISEERTHTQTKDEIHLRCNQKAVEQIEKINIPIVVLAVVGRHNTDTSHLMNHLGTSFYNENNATYIFSLTYADM
jgi:hypothetical protein